MRNAFVAVDAGCATLHRHRHDLRRLLRYSSGYDEPEILLSSTR